MVPRLSGGLSRKIAAFQLFFRTLAQTAAQAGKKFRATTRKIAPDKLCAHFFQWNMLLAQNFFVLVNIDENFVAQASQTLAI